MLLMTGLTTLIQMKNHPVMHAMINNTRSYHKNWVRQRRKTVTIIKIGFYKVETDKLYTILIGYNLNIFDGINLTTCHELLLVI